MPNGRIRPERRREVFVALLVLVCAFTLRIWGITERFTLLRDQIRDWEIALGPFAHLPLVGPATHVHGYTIGPAFYWILWAIRVVIGPWFQNLPHAGGIGQALLQSAADALLLVAIWRRVGSMWIALATIVLVVTAPFDLSLSATVWNPTMGSTLAKAATSLILLDWHRGGTARAAATVAVTWMAIHAYTGTVYVAVAVFAAALLDPLVRGERRLAWRNAAVTAVVVVLLQIPYLAYRFSHPNEPAMAAVSGSLTEVLSGRAHLRFSESEAGYLKAFNDIEIAPWHFPFSGVLLVVCAAIVVVRYRRDLPLLLMTIAPSGLAVAGYAFFLSALDNYYYLSVLPGAVLMVMLAVAAIPSQRAVRAIAIAIVCAGLVTIPQRRSYAMTLHQMPEYGAILHASRVLAARGTPVLGIRTEFELPPTNDPEFVYRILGGRVERSSPWIAVIQRNGDVRYENVGQR